MNEKLQYATMLEIPVSTASVTFSPQKKKRAKKKKVNPDVVKQELLNKVNSEMEEKSLLESAQEEEKIATAVYDDAFDLEGQDKTDFEQVQTEKPKKKNKFGVTVIGVQLAIIGMLIATIFLTNAIYTDSGINVFLREVFGAKNTQTVDAREYDDFAPVIAMSGLNASLTDGLITFSGEGSVYAPCDGKVSKITKEADDTFTVEITHSSNFKSVLSGLEYAYAGLDDSVYSNIPVGYSEATATMCFTKSDGAVISDYQIVDDAVVWAV